MRAFFRIFETWGDPFRSPPTDTDGHPQDLPNEVLPFIGYFFSQMRWPFAAMLVISGLIGLIETALYASVGLIVDTLRTANPETVWSDNAGLFLGLAFMVLVARTLAMGLSSVISEQTITPTSFYLVRWQAHRRVLRQSYAFFQDDFAGRIATKVMQSGQAVGDFLLNLIQGIWQFIIFGVVTVGVFATFDWRLSLILTIWFVAYFGLLAATLGEIRRRSQAMSNMRAALTGRIVDSYTNVATVKLFAGIEREDAFVREGMERTIERVLALGRYVSGLRFALVALNGVLMTVTGALAVWLWQQQAMTVGAVAVTLGMVLRLNHMSGWISFQINGLFRDLGTIGDSVSTISQPIAVQDRPNAKPLPPHGAGALTFHNVSFGYGRGVAALENLALDVAPGERLGIVGHSGAGKSTLVSCMLRLYDLEGGIIEIDGHDISKVTQDSLRANIGVVTQDTSLLHRSVFDNIAYGRPNATQADVKAAASRARAHEFIVDLADAKGRTGYDAHVGERGVKLSGGQRQRIAIARVLLKDAPILVLDEATSALDSEAEAAIQEQFANLMQGKTVLAIAHRLSTIAAMDRLIVMDAGRIVEEGSHDDLIAHGGIYASLWSRQSGGFLAVGGTPTGDGDVEAKAEAAE